MAFLDWIKAGLKISSIAGVIKLLLPAINGLLGFDITEDAVDAVLKFMGYIPLPLTTLFFLKCLVLLYVLRFFTLRTRRIDYPLEALAEDADFLDDNFNDMMEYSKFQKVLAAQNKSEAEQTKLEKDRETRIKEDGAVTHVPRAEYGETGCMSTGLPWGKFALPIILTIIVGFTEATWVARKTTKAISVAVEIPIGLQTCSKNEEVELHSSGPSPDISCGKSNDERSCYENALELDPSHALVWYNFGVAGGGKVEGQNYDARLCYEKALTLDPSHAKAWYNFGVVGGGTIEGQDYDNHSCYDKALELDAICSDVPTKARNSLKRYGLSAGKNWWSSQPNTYCKKSGNTVPLNEGDGFDMSRLKCRVKCQQMPECNVYTYGKWETGLYSGKTRCQLYEKCEGASWTSTSLFEKCKRLAPAGMAWMAAGDRWTSHAHTECKKLGSVPLNDEYAFGMSFSECQAQCLESPDCNMYTYGELENPGWLKFGFRRGKMQCRTYEKCEHGPRASTSLFTKLQ